MICYIGCSELANFWKIAGVDYIEVKSLKDEIDKIMNKYKIVLVDEDIISNIKELQQIAKKSASSSSKVFILPSLKERKNYTVLFLKYLAVKALGIDPIKEKEEEIK